MGKDNVQHRFVSLTADPGTLTDGNVWYRSDLEALRVRIDGVTYSLVPDIGAISNYWYTASWDAGSSGQTPVVNRLYASPLTVPRTGVINALAMNVTTQFTTAGNVRLGIYANAANGCAPDVLLLDCGTQSATTGTKTFTGLSQTVGPGLYWLVAVFQGGSAGSPVQRCLTGHSPYVGQVAGTPDVTLASQPGYYRDTVSGALPNPFGAIAGGIQTTKIMVRYN